MHEQVCFLLVRILYEFLLALTCGLATEGRIVTITKPLPFSFCESDRLMDTRVNAVFSSVTAVLV